MKTNWKLLWSARIAIFLVFFFNLQCAFAFLFSPDLYAPSFDLTGITGNIVIQAMAILFFMWNVPYFFALLNPVKNFTSLKEAILMQLIGGLGETLIYYSIGSSHTIIRNSIARFMLFDWSGLILLIIALFITICYSRQGLIREIKE